MPFAKQAHDVESSMQFIKADSKLNRRYITPGLEINTGKYETHPVLVRDVRPLRKEYTLETTGFQLFEHKSSLVDFTDRDQIDKIYAAEIEAFVQSMTKADKVITYRPYIRHSQAKPGIPRQPPAIDAHVDITARAAARQAREFMDTIDPDFQYTRAVHLSCWRAFSTPPQDWPLALCNARSVRDEEGLVNSAIWQTEVPDVENLPPLPEVVKSEAYAFPYREEHEWCYFSGMTRDELLCLKLNDSDHSRPWRTPHCSFYNDEEGTHARESVEIRAVCYFK